MQKGHRQRIGTIEQHKHDCATHSTSARQSITDRGSRSGYSIFSTILRSTHAQNICDMFIVNHFNHSFHRECLCARLHACVRSARVVETKCKALFDANKPCSFPHAPRGMCHAHLMHPSMPPHLRIMHNFQQTQNVIG